MSSHARSVWAVRARGLAFLVCLILVSGLWSGGFRLHVVLIDLSRHLLAEAFCVSACSGVGSRAVRLRYIAALIEALKALFEPLYKVFFSPKEPVLIRLGENMRFIQPLGTICVNLMARERLFFRNTNLIPSLFYLLFRIAICKPKP